LQIDIHFSMLFAQKLSTHVKKTTFCFHCVQHIHTIHTNVHC
jgi:hypothetical protein